jgi:hypothetical protein
MKQRPLASMSGLDPDQLAAIAEWLYSRTYAETREMVLKSG